jgi:Tfp pilus assembly protein PilP
MKNVIQTSVVFIVTWIGTVSASTTPSIYEKYDLCQFYDFHIYQLAEGIYRSWFYIKTEDGVVTGSILKNDFLGKNHGKVTLITESKIEIVEIHPDGKGGWKEVAIVHNAGDGKLKKCQ